MRALLIMFLIVAILTPGFLLGFLVSPWFFLIFGALLVLFPVFLAPKPATAGEVRSGTGEGAPGALVWGLWIAALVVGIPILVLGFLIAPGFFLMMLVVTWCTALSTANPQKRSNWPLKYSGVGMTSMCQQIRRSECMCTNCEKS